MKKLTLLLITYISSFISTKAQTCPVVSSVFEPTTVASTGKLSPYDLATDDYGNIYIAGAISGAAVHFNNSVPSITDASTKGFFVAKYDKFGNTQWAINMGNSESADYLTGIAVSPDGSKIYVTGRYRNTAVFGSHSITSVFNNAGTTRTYDVFVAKLSDNGGTRTWDWAISGGGKGDDYSRGIAIDNFGKVYIGGHIDSKVAGNEGVAFGSITFNNLYGDDSFVARLTDNNTSTTWDWVQKSSASVAPSTFITYDDDIFAISCNKTNGDVFVTGYFYQDGGASAHTFSFAGISIPNNQCNDNEAFVYKLNTNGIGQWVNKAGGFTTPYFGNEQGRGIAVDSVGNVFVMGDFTSTTRFGLTSQEIPDLMTAGSFDVFIGRINANGTWAWAKKMGGNNIETGGGIEYHNGQVWGVGVFRDVASFKIPNQLISNGTTPTNKPYDVFLVNLDKNGNWLGDGATQMGGPDEDRMYYSDNGYSMGLAIDPNNVPCLAGRYTGTAAVFGSTTLTRAGENPFVVRVNCGETPLVCNQQFSASYPANENPFVNYNANMQITSMLKDATGNTYLCGKITGNVQFNMADGTNIFTFYPADGSAFVTMLNSNNLCVYFEQFGGTNATAYDIAFSDEGIVVVGDFSGTGTFPIFNSRFGYDWFSNASVTSNGSTDIFVGEIVAQYNPFLFNVEYHFHWLKTAGGAAGDHGTAIANAGNTCAITGYLGASASNILFGSNTVPPTSGTYTMLIANIIDYYDNIDNEFITLWTFAETPSLNPSSTATATASLGYDITMNSVGNIYATGTYQYEVSANPDEGPMFGSLKLPSTKGFNVVVVGLSPAGIWSWVTKAGNNVNFGHFNRAFGMTIGDDFLYLTGAISSPNSPGFIDVIKFGKTTAVSDIPDISGVNQELLVAKLNTSNGNWIWARTGSGGAKTTGGIAFKNNTIYLVGEFQNSVNIGGINLTSAGNFDLYMAQMTYLGQFLQHKIQRGGGVNTDRFTPKNAVNYNHPIAVDNNGSIFTAGYFKNTTTFGNSTLTNNFNSNNTAMIVKSECLACAINPIVLSNPAQNIPSFNPTQKTASSITATNWVTSGTVLYQAGTSITLSPGFKVESGTVFKAQMGGCN